MRPSPTKTRLAQFIYHHPVIKEDSATTQLRVVFNASCLTSNGTLLNNHLLIRPKLQKDITAIISRWRGYHYVYTADIAKMFRQILIDPADIDYQQILWRDAVSGPVKHYQLLTVTYGTSAPYLANRVLQQLARDEGSRFPLAKSIVENNVYVDDLLFGANDLNTALCTRDEVI